ncbi:neuroglobin-like [Gigantopelta aegis]|uniref:neuroglobin-like n=1 Tax=Gigantopelta aegis TaxID=1735272 RepID=UPI001B88B2DE|nr:neuroglobin-like [Gigantopelta aegis]XP_041353196.1 neuroglobin-like [Gigantopelta aegis]
MGCGSSSNKMKVPFSELDKMYIRETWVQFSDGGIVESGQHLFLKMFEKRPDIKDLFLYSKDGNVASKMFGKNRQFNNHVRRVFEMLGSVVSNLDEYWDVEPLLVSLGSKHATFALQKDYFLLFGDCLMYSLERKLGDKLTPEAKQAWHRMVKFVIPLMISGWTIGTAKLKGHG